MDVFQQAVRKSFAFLKSTARLDDLFAKSMPLGDAGYLVPVCELHCRDAQLIAKLTAWRAENAFAYPTQFRVTESGTAAWLRGKLLDVEDRILFLVLDRFGTPVGHLGFASAINPEGRMEIDNVVRGVRGAEPGIMAKATQALLDWADQDFGPREIFLRVMSDNEHAVSFYRRLGFHDDGLTPLRRHSEGERVDYHPLTEADSAAPDKYFLRMVYRSRRQVDASQVILTAGPSISAREASYAIDATRNGWNANWSGYLSRFEKQFADYIGCRHALSTSSCTGALHLALAALGVGPGDEVLVPDITWVATANAVMYVGATPVFVDVDADTWCLDAECLERSITSRTKAVMPVHLYGHPAPMGRIMEIARKHGLYVVEDAAPAIGAECDGQRVGTFGDFAAFSFQGAKLVVSGEGGMLLTNDDALLAKAYALWDQGRTPGTFWINQLGWKYKMSNVQAAIGLAQLERVDELIEAKRRIFSWYEEGLQDLPHVRLNSEAPWARSIYWMTSILLDENAGISRDALRSDLRQRGIDTRSVFPAISQYPFWPRRQPPQPTAFRVGNQAINLPSGVCLRREQVAYVCTAIRDLLRSAGNAPKPDAPKPDAAERSTAGLH